jgi:outer membrane immunogenic protein
VQSKLSSFGTVRGRAGVAVDRLLLYVTGGLAIAHITDTARNDFNNGVSLFGQTSGTRSGTAFGGGAEIAIASNWSLKAEYLRLDLGSSSVTIADPVNLPGSFATYSFHHDINIARGGIDYRF